DRAAGMPAGAVRDRHRRDAGVPRTGVSRRCAHAGAPRNDPAVRLEGLAMSPLDSDIAHLLAGSMVLLSFLLLYQDRMFALLNVFALHAYALACSVAWQ